MNDTPAASAGLGVREASAGKMHSHPSCLRIAPRYPIGIRLSQIDEESARAQVRTYAVPGTNASLQPRLLHEPELVASRAHTEKR